MSEIPEVGRCAGCDRMGKLTNKTCTICVKRWGKKAGPIIEQIRTDPKFARDCYERLPIWPPRPREEFVKLFGLPEEYVGF